MHFKLVIQYDGTGFHGSQMQAPDRGRTVQGELEKALGTLARVPVKVDLAGRTDTGVHALGQVASLDFPARDRLDNAASIMKALNAHLPEDLKVTSAEQAEQGFHARFSARQRAYRYLLLNSEQPQPLMARYSLHVSRPLDLEGMQGALSLLVGTHDLAAFAGHGMGKPGGGDGERPSTVRTISIARLVSLSGHANPWQWDAPGAGAGQTESLLAVDLVANAFLPHMIRNIVGLLLEVGSGRRTVEDFGSVLESRDRRRAGQMARPHGLCLLWVEY